MRIATATFIGSTVLLLTVARAVERNSPALAPTPQAAEAVAQETVKLAVSGMT